MKTYHVTWEEIQSRLSLYDKQGEKIYGVPKGGMILTALLKYAEPVVVPEAATLILDDCIDTGITKEHHAKYTVPFVALFNRCPDTRVWKDVPGHESDWLVFPWEHEEKSGPADAVVRLLEFVGESPKREGLLETPQRVLKAWKEMTSGYQQDPKEILSKTFTADYDELVTLRGVEFYSTCEHHLLPFYGTASVGYIPRGRVVGISKLARLVECFARRLQLQEQMTSQIANAIDEHLKPLGVAVVLTATHQCMACRGVKQGNASLVTSAMFGKFRDDRAARAEFFSCLRP